MDQLITLLVLTGIFISLLKDMASPVISFLSGLTVLILTGVITTSEALAGFSNENLIIIGSLFVLARALQATININSLAGKTFGNPGNTRTSLLRLMVPVSASSAFINNTPVVAMLINPIINWSREHDIPASRFLIPLSYAAIFGGALTLIGTSTNLVVSGLLSDYGYEPLSFFELTKIGLPLAAIGLTAIALLAPKIIPDRDLANLDEADIEKGFTIDVSPREKVINKTVVDAGLRNLKDVFLIEIIRANGDILSPVSPEAQIRKDDILRFSGNADALAKLAKKQNLKPVEHKHVVKLNNSQNVYIESVVGHNKSIAGKTLTEIGFRSKYQAAVLAIFRSGEKIKGSLGSLQLKPGDSLLLVSDEGFEGRWQDRSDFLYLRQIGSASKKNGTHSKNFYMILLSMLALALLQMPLAIIVLSGALMTIALKINTTSQAKNSIDFELLIMIAAAIGVARAVDVSGLAMSASTFIIDNFQVFGVTGLLLGVILATSILTELVTNNAAALLVFPIAITTAVSAGADPRIFAMAIAIAASLSFVSPLGYQTNTMVYSAGGYKFSDFFRLGIILNILTTISLVTIMGVFFL